MFRIYDEIEILQVGRVHVVECLVSFLLTCEPALDRSAHIGNGLSLLAHSALFQYILKYALCGAISVKQEKSFERVRHPMPRKARIYDELVFFFAHSLQTLVYLMVNIFLYFCGNIRGFD